MLLYLLVMKILNLFAALIRSFLHILCFSPRQHPFIKSAKPNSILRALITDAMEIKLKRQEEAEQREQEADDDDNSVCNVISNSI